MVTDSKSILIAKLASLAALFCKDLGLIIAKVDDDGEGINLTKADNRFYQLRLADNWRDKSRVVVYAIYHEHGRFLPSEFKGEKSPSVQVSVERPDATILKDVSRRLLADYDRWLVESEAGYRAHLDRVAKFNARVEHYASLMGVQMNTDKDSDGQYKGQLGYNLTQNGNYGTVHVSSSSSIRIEGYFPDDLGEIICTMLANYAHQSKNTA